MKTYVSIALPAVMALSLTACFSEDFCDKVTCGEGGDGSTSTTAQGSPTTGTTTGGSPTSSSSGGGGDGGSSVSTNSGGGGDGGAGSTSTGTGGAPPGCELVNGEAITGTDCAIFVNNEYTGDESGTRDAPYTTITQAVVAAAASGKSIYVCDGQISAYDEAVDIADSVSLVGGFGCSSWIWTEAGRTEWTAGADQIPLKVTAGASVSVANFAITAADADIDTAGGSSIAVLVAGSSLEVLRSEVTAGDGTGGSEANQEDRADPAESGSKGSNGCTAQSTGASVTGGANSCAGSVRDGGESGDGSTSPSFGGTATPGSPAPPEGGVAGLGQGSASCADGGTGGTGDSGVSGNDGEGATELGALTSNGFAPVSGGAATAGTPGAGGGGGGGGWRCTNLNFGPSGGSGGAGGCGGNPGIPGGGGGSSIAIALVNATVAFEGVTLFVGSGGRGGDGAPGQLGQVGGDPGNAGDGLAGQGSTACPGGAGGSGGNGGDAGGGRGGHALAIAYVGTVPSSAGVSFGNSGTPGLGGERSDGLVAGRGGDGIADDVLALQP